MDFVDYSSIHAMLKQTVERYGDTIAYKWFTGPEQTDSVTWNQFYSQVRQVGKSLIALGVKKGDKVNILSYSCYQWILCDMGITSIGSVTVGIYQSDLPRNVRYIVDHSDAVVIFVEDNVQLAKLMDVRADIPDIFKVILFTGDVPADDWVIGFEEFMALGTNVTDIDFDSRTDAVKPSDPAGIIYTSGTTGVPKGAVLTHDNITFTAQSVKGSTKIIKDVEGFLFLPLAHVFARTCVYTALLTGSSMTITRSMATIAEDIRVAKPHWFASVPRIFEKVYAKVISSVEAKGGAALRMFRWACKVGDAVSDCKLKKQPVPFGLKVKYALATKLVFSKVQAALGGRVRWCISGAAPLNPSIAKFFHAAGILIVEGLGMTENTSFSNLNRYDNYRFGWVGPPGPGIEQKIAEDGEVMYRGRNVMKEYYKMPKETAETITPDGWLYTGDIGEIDSEDFLRITGRKKELIITAGGKNISPSTIEGVISTSKYINQICIIGDKRKFLTALVTLDPENVKKWSQVRGISFNSLEELVTNEKVRAMIEKEVAEKNEEFASFETIKKITIVPEFTIENGLLTPTMKLKKSVVITKYEKKIDAMYLDD